MPEVEIGGEEILFQADWNLNVNNRTIDPIICVEMLDHIALPRDIMFESQILSLEMMTYLPAPLRQVSAYIQLVVVIVYFFGV